MLAFLRARAVLTCGDAAPGLFDPRPYMEQGPVSRVEWDFASRQRSQREAELSRHRHRVRPLQDQPARRVKAGGEAAHTVSTARRMRLPWLR